jgi:hypothetical protein
MNKCVFYLRDEADDIQRLDSLGEVSLKGLSGSYLFEEALMDFSGKNRVLVDAIWPMRWCCTCFLLYRSLIRVPRDPACL